jgi:alpha-N-arabinofuranosidase
MRHSRRNFLRTATLTAGALSIPRWGAADEAAAQEPSRTQDILVRADVEIGRIRPELHGQFAEHLGSCIYGGLWVGPKSPIENVNGFRKQAIDWLRELGVPVLRWPGGCFADDYHWRDGVGAPKDRPRSLNVSWGNVIEDNSFGTDEFIQLCRMIGAQPYLAGNVGSASPQEMRDWIEYCNFPEGTTLSDMRIKNGAKEPFAVRYWGVGNESWGCGGNMPPAYYGELYRRYSTFLHNMGGTKLFLIASGPSGDDVRWTREVLDVCQTHMPNGLSMHYYSGGPAETTHFTPKQAVDQFAIFKRVEEAIAHQREVVDGYRRGNETALILDEWGVWDRIDHDDEKKNGMLWQQSTMRSAVAAGLGLNIFNRLADKLYMCNIAQIVNVLQSMLLTDGPEGHRCVRTTTYHAFMLLKEHRDKTSVVTHGDTSSPQSVSVSASRTDRKLVVSLVNPSVSTAVTAHCSLQGFIGVRASGQMMHSDDLNAYNSFDRPDLLHPAAFSPVLEGAKLTVELPPLSVSTVTVEG